MSDFPIVLTNKVDGPPGVGTPILAKDINNLEAKVGIDGSVVATSLDYLLKNSASIEPGHRHNKLWNSDGSFEAVTVDVNGYIGALYIKSGWTVAIVLSDSVLNHGMTGVIAADEFYHFEERTVDHGGVIMRALNDSTQANNAAITFIGINGSTTPTVSPILFRVGKKSGTTYAALAATEMAVSFQNYTTELMTIMGGGNVGIGTTPNAVALLHLASTTKGFLPPVMTTTQKNAISSPPEGLVVYDSTLHTLCVRVAAAWETVTSG